MTVDTGLTAQAPTLGELLNSGDWVPGPEFQVHISDSHVRVVGHALLALDNLIVAAVLAEIGQEGNPAARSFVAENIALVVTEASVGSFGGKVKSYIRKTLLPTLHEKAIEAIVVAAFSSLAVAAGLSGGPTPPPEDTASCPGGVIESIAPIRDTLPPGGRVTITLRKADGTTVWITIEQERR